MGIAVLVIVLLYLLGSIIALVVVRKVFKRWWPVLVLGVGLALYPFYDLIIVKTLYWHYARQGPLQEIKRTVDKPESVLWIDEVWPGFDEYGRDWMVKSYIKPLREEYLSKLAVNGDDGKIYLFRTEANDRPEVFDSLKALPPLRYHVVFRPVPLNWFEKRFIHADEIRIIDTQKNEVIAYSRRYLAYSPKSGFDIVGDSPFRGGKTLGDERAYEFDDKVLFRYAGVRGGLDRIKNSFRKGAYNLNAIEWKSKRKGASL